MSGEYHGFTGRELRSKLDEDGRLSLSLEQVLVEDPAADEIVVRVEAAPINPSDLGLLLGPVDLSTLETRDRQYLAFRVPASRMPSVAGRIGQSTSVGDEGAGLVVVAGKDAAHLNGKRVGMIGGGMYADYRRIKARDVIPLPDGATAAEGASSL